MPFVAGLMVKGEKHDESESSSSSYLSGMQLGNYKDEIKKLKQSKPQIFGRN